jgi:hypothetical protein
MRILKFIGSSLEDLVFQKKSPKTAKQDIELAIRRYKQMENEV